MGYRKTDRGLCWREAVRRKPQGLSLDLVLFNIFLSDLGTKNQEQDNEISQGNKARRRPHYKGRQ